MTWVSVWRQFTCSAAQQLTVTIGFRQAPPLDESEIDEVIALLATLEGGWGAR
jgi:hypothetical protein